MPATAAELLFYLLSKKCLKTLAFLLFLFLEKFFPDVSFTSIIFAGEL